MKTLTINVPDSLDVNQERQFLARNWYQSGKLSAAQAAEVAGLSVSVFLALAEPQSVTDRLLQQMARPVSAHYDLEALKRDKQYGGLNWNKLDQLADAIGLQEDSVDLLAQLTK